MKIVANAVAGTLESNDVLVTVAPGSAGLQLHVESIVLQQFGEQIERAVRDTADELGVTDAVIELNDRGAVQCTIQARVETALKRAAEVTV